MNNFIIEGKRRFETKLLPFMHSKDDVVWFGYDSAYVKKKHNRLTEGLITSLNQEEVKSFIERKFNTDGINIEYPSNGEVLEIFKWIRKQFDPESKNYIFILGELKNILQFLKLAGWYSIGSMVQNNKGASIDEAIILIEEFIKENSSELLHDFYINLKLEPKYNEEYIFDLLPDNVYHIAPAKYGEKIEKIGLKPHSKKKMYKHLDRIYLFVPKNNDFEDSTNALNNFSEQLASFSEKDVKEMNIYKISKESLKGMKLYHDPIFERGIYIMSNIPPNKIELERTVKVN